MKYGAGTIAAQRFGASEIIDPRPYTVRSISETFTKYPYIGKLLPAMGYSKEQLEDLEATINKSGCEAVVIGTPIDLAKLIDFTPIDLAKLIDFKVPATRARYELQEIGKPSLKEILQKF